MSDSTPQSSPSACAGTRGVVPSPCEKPPADGSNGLYNNRSTRPGQHNQPGVWFACGPTCSRALVITVKISGADSAANARTDPSADRPVALALLAICTWGERQHHQQRAPCYNIQSFAAECPGSCRFMRTIRVHSPGRAAGRQAVESVCGPPWRTTVAAATCTVSSRSATRPPAGQNSLRGPPAADRRDRTSIISGGFRLRPVWSQSRRLATPEYPVQTQQQKLGPIPRPGNQARHSRT